MTQHCCMHIYTEASSVAEELRESLAYLPHECAWTKKLEMLCKGLDTNSDNDAPDLHGTERVSAQPI